MLGTGDALSLTDTDVTVFRNAVAKGYFTAVPPSSTAHTRDWNDERHLAVLLFFRRLTSTGAPVPYASELANQFSIGMEKSPKASELGVYTVPRPEQRAVELFIRERAPEGATLVFKVRASDYRRQARALLAKHRKQFGA